MEKPDVDSIEGICPAIAIRQKNSIRNPRSTVGTTTEIHDYLRLLYARVGRTFCRGCGKEVIRETAEVVAARLSALPRRHAPARSASTCRSWRRRRCAASRAGAGGRGRVGRRRRRRRRAAPQPVLPDLVDSVAETIAALRRKGFGRLYVSTVGAGQTVNLDDVDTATLQGPPAAPGDRRSPEGGSRTSASASPIRSRPPTPKAAARRSRWHSRPTAAKPVAHRFSERFECRECNLQYEVPQPRLFSFNNPFGACPLCHGFGNIIELDMALVVPDASKSIQQNAIEPWSKPHYRAQLVELKRVAKKRVRLEVPWSELDEDEKRFVIEGDGGGWEGVKGFFRWLERKKYKVHVRVFLSRYRGYLTCPECNGARLRREARDVRVGERTIDVVCGLTVKDADRFFETLTLSEKDARRRRQGPARDPQAARLPARRRARLPDARSAVVDALGRRVAAHQPGDLARIGAGRIRSTCSTSRRSACTRATTSGSSRSCASCATRATPSSSSSTTPT